MANLERVNELLFSEERLKLLNFLIKLSMAYPYSKSLMALETLKYARLQIYHAILRKAALIHAILIKAD